jgi:enoyl-CoA hydratase
MTTDDLGTPYLTFERVGSVGWCTVNRPEYRNALTPAMYLGIRRAVDRVNDDPELAALVITFPEAS